MKNLIPNSEKFKTLIYLKQFYDIFAIYENNVLIPSRKMSLLTKKFA